MLTITLIFIGIVAWVVSVVICANRYSSSKIKNLKETSNNLKLIIEDSIKDRRIDEEEYDKLRNAVLDLEEKLEE